MSPLDSPLVLWIPLKSPLGPMDSPRVLWIPLESPVGPVDSPRVLWIPVDFLESHEFLWIPLESRGFQSTGFQQDWDSCGLRQDSSPVQFPKNVESTIQINGIGSPLESTGIPENPQESSGIQWIYMGDSKDLQYLVYMLVFGYCEVIQPPQSSLRTQSFRHHYVHIYYLCIIQAHVQVHVL